MPVSPLVDANCEVIIRNEFLEDDGEIRNLINFESTLKLNDVSSWKIEMHTDDWRATNLNLGGGIMFLRDNMQVLTGPVMDVKVHELAGARTTTIIGGCDNAYLATRMCYPVVEGLIYEDGLYRFGKRCLANGITTTLAKDTVVDESTCTVTDATGFFVGARLSLPDYSDTPTIEKVDLSTNVITIAAGTWSVVSPAGEEITQVDSTGVIVDDPAYKGYDTRTGSAETVMKELVFYNAGSGACVDQFGPRAITYLSVAPTHALGNTLTSNARGEPLLTQVQNCALSGGVNFQLKQVGQGLVFDVWKGKDLTEQGELVFSAESRTLKEAEFDFGLPEANFIMGAGSDAGVNKLMMPAGDMVSISQYGRFEQWGSAASGNSGDTPEQISAAMLSESTNQLIAKAYNSNLAISIQETDQVRFPRDFALGDKVRTMIGNEPTDQVVTNIYYTVPAGGASGSGSAVGAFSKLQMSRLMIKQNRQGDLLNSMLLR